MKQSQYNRLRAWEVKGRKVRLTAEVANRLVIIPAGAICTITQKYGGFNIEGPACSSCGVQAVVSKVHPSKVELLPKGT